MAARELRAGEDAPHLATLIGRAALANSRYSGAQDLT